MTVKAWARWQAQRVIDKAGNRLLPPPRTCFGATINHGARDRARVALTFDDGPSPPATDHTLDALDDLGVTATFFVIGQLVAEYPDTLRRIAAAGHVIGSHTQTHSRHQAMSIRGTGHLDPVDEQLDALIGVRPAFYRPPWGWLAPWDARRAHDRGMRVVGWDVYPPDWQVPTPSPAQIASFVCQRAQAGSIILLHDAHSGAACTKTETAAALPSIVGRLRDRGLEFVTVPELLGVPAYREPIAVSAA